MDFPFKAVGSTLVPVVLVVSDLHEFVNVMFVLLNSGSSGVWAGVSLCLSERRVRMWL